MSRVHPGKVVLVTGASSGIGLSCSELLCRAGYRVYGASRRGTDLLENGDSGFVSLRMDVTSDESVLEAVDSVLEREQRIDVLINNAGIGIAGAVEDTSVAEAREQFEVNFFGVLRTIRAVLPIMRNQSSGYIVNIGSIGGLIAIPYQGLYSASKFALEGLTESLRFEVSRLGIRVVLIEPGDHRTAFTVNRQLTEASSLNSAYLSSFKRSIDRSACDEQAGPAPESVARLVYKVINRRDPRLRYTTGPMSQRAAVWLKRVVPYSFMGRLLEMYYRQPR